MLSINTNMPSLIAQRSLNNSTKLLNQAIERMSTGFKINHASDNAANYSITTNMNTKLSSYQVAEDNVAMGLDLLSTAGGSLDLISDKLTRLRALAEQSANGTYGEQSLKAINSEANAIVDEIERIYSTAEYNGIQLFGETKSQFIEEVQQLTESEAVAQGYTIIRTAEDLHKMDNSSDKFILMNDIDLSGYSTGEGWQPIAAFNGTFNGNGYVISNLYINRSDELEVGLFGEVTGEIKNLGVENVDITATGASHYDHVGAIVGDMSDGSILSNCYATGSITGSANCVGGLAGHAYNVENCYADVDVEGTDMVGGLFGYIGGGRSWSISNCYVRGSVSGDTNVGGIAGRNAAYKGGYIMENCSVELSSIQATDPNAVGIFTGIEESSNCSIKNSTYSSNLSNLKIYGDSNQTMTIDNVTAIDNRTFLQVGINSDEASQISIDTTFNLGFRSLRGIGNGGNYLSKIDSMINTISAKQTEYGAAENRLESALEEINTQYDNLVSSRSTLRDADIAEVSSEYIRQQILQQASATLMATANQSPALALQLL